MEGDYQKKLKHLVFLLMLLMSVNLSAQSLIDMKGTRMMVDTSKWRLSGTNIYSKNTGNVGISNPSPSYKLDVSGKGRFTDSLVVNSVRIMGIAAGTVNDSLLVIEPATGIVRRIAVNRLPGGRPDSTTASNGLTLTGKDVQLGGALTKPTTIGTSATNTLALSGLSGGNLTTDSVLVVNNAGVIKRASMATFPRVDLDADRTSNYTPGVAYATIVYNTVNTNVSSQYNSGTGIFTAAEDGLYQVMVTNMYNGNIQGDAMFRNRVILNGSVVELEGSVAFSPYSSGSGLDGTISLTTVLSLAAGDNLRIQGGGEVGNIRPRYSTGQHKLQIVRLR